MSALADTEVTAETVTSASEANRADIAGVDFQRSQDSGDQLPHTAFSCPPPRFSDQVLENVLCFLTSPQDRNAASLVCKSWFRAKAQARSDLFIGNCYVVSPARAINRFPLVHSLVMKGKPGFADFNPVPFGWGALFSPSVSPMAPAYPWLMRICLKRMSVADADLFLIARSFTPFRDLSLICCEGFTTSALAAIAENCSWLRSLDLIENDFDDDKDEVVDWMSRFPSGKTCLESLVFDCVGCAVNFEALEDLVARSPSLRQPRVNEHLSLERLCRLMMRAPQLTHLGTESFASYQEEIGFEAALESAFRACNSLVCLSGFFDLAPEYLPTIYPVCSNLTSLNFSFAQISADQLKLVINRCHNLQTLWVLDSVRDEGLQMVAATCKKLMELSVFPLDATEDSESSLSDVGLTAIFEGCIKLQCILYFCQSMTNAAIVAMSKNCEDLVVFRLCIMGRHRPDYLSREPMDEGFGAIVKNNKKVTRLAVSGLLTDKAFAYIGAFGKAVRTLSVAFAGISDLGLRYVLEGCANLQNLEITDCPFGDAGLLSEIHHYYNLRFLWMSSCKISLKGCQEAARRLPNMVVEVIRDRLDDDHSDVVEKLYMYRSLVVPRNDAPPLVMLL